MNYLNPIHTEKRQCQDCYKCVRNCPVKAIKVEGACAMILPESCILCGNCVAVCPNGAKKIRDDVHRARQLMVMRSKVIVSLAPSFVAAFSGVRPAQMIAAIKRLGFHGVSETALGAQHVSAHVASLLAGPEKRILVSSACPTVVSYLQKHRSADAKRITPVLSPLLTHCKLLRSVFGPEIGIVFFGPCIAKKAEADGHPDLLDVALTFEDLFYWFEQEKIDPKAIQETADDHFIPECATDGAIYPVDGGMIAGIKANCGVNDAAFMTFSGLSAIEKAIEGLDHLELDRSLMLELLACEGGCVNGPAMGEWTKVRGATVAKRYQVLRHSQYSTEEVPRKPVFAIDADFTAKPVNLPQFTEDQIRVALSKVGKFAHTDELNCGGCGYDSCRAFAGAMLNNMAERSMCVTYMRQLAHKKADALIQKMPSAVVIVDAQLKIVECNAAFVRLFAPGASNSLPAQMEGAELANLVPFHRVFAGVLRSGEDIVDRDLQYRETILHVSIFNVEKHVLVGGIIQDITKPAVQKEQVIRKAREVIQKNLSTVQQIAYLLGENAAESEITLNSIIESFSLRGIDEETRSGGNKEKQCDQLNKNNLGSNLPVNEPPKFPPGGGDWRQRYRR
ncbi:MAG TPA: [Fe-Fe] hydrogenase large subunit C-terminal domain-containing protein [Tepidisphaeraceae bacterium]|nr:[Fe-Fe] hydrogenase large subunit C-terminal domain-containing protein [Tepidisphaeraceae bacterium]